MVLLIHVQISVMRTIFTLPHVQERVGQTLMLLAEDVMFMVFVETQITICHHHLYPMILKLEYVGLGVFTLLLQIVSVL